MGARYTSAHPVIFLPSQLGASSSFVVILFKPSYLGANSLNSTPVSLAPIYLRAPGAPAGRCATAATLARGNNRERVGCNKGAAMLLLFAVNSESEMERMKTPLQHLDAAAAAARQQLHSFNGSRSMRLGS